MGKTTFLEKLIAVLGEKGYRVGAVKSDCHGFDIDIPGKDSWRLARAGAAVTAIAGPDKNAVIYRTEERKNLDQIASDMNGVDLILAEGFKNEPKPKIEIIRKEKGEKITAALMN
jgi:molybdopterin-guanine dinucleotide biosynthesis protein B